MEISFLSDPEIARRARLRPLSEVASDIGVGEYFLESYDDKVAKIKLEAVEKLEDRPRTKYVLVSSITPPLGEGKTTNSEVVGLF